MRLQDTPSEATLLLRRIVLRRRHALERGANERGLIAPEEGKGGPRKKGSGRRDARQLVPNSGAVIHNTEALLPGHHVAFQRGYNDVESVRAGAGYSSEPEGVGRPHPERADDNQQGVIHFQSWPRRVRPVKLKVLPPPQARYSPGEGLGAVSNLSGSVVEGTASGVPTHP